MAKNVILDSFRLDVMDNAGDLVGIESEWLHLIESPEFIANHTAEELSLAHRVISRLKDFK